jgi:hypothetical protein
MTPAYARSTKSISAAKAPERNAFMTAAVSSLELSSPRDEDTQRQPFLQAERLPLS